MKNKIHPKDQSRKLLQAELEFTKRSPKLGGTLKKVMVETSESLLADDGAIKAVYGWWPREDLYKEIPSETSEQKKCQRMTEILKKGVCRFFSHYLNLESPLLVNIDLRRSKEVIMAEVESIVSKYKQRYQKLPEAKKERLKWLSIINKCLEVWDLCEKSGKQPTCKTFPQIVRKVNRPLSTVKSQWRLAYEKIYGVKYNPDFKYSTQEKRDKATALCTKCPSNFKCYKKKKEERFEQGKMSVPIERMVWIPCLEYLKVAGKEKVVTRKEYRDDILYEA